MARVLVPDALSAPVLAAVRSLSRYGDECSLAWPSSALDRRLSGRAVTGWRAVTSPRRDVGGYIDDLARICRDGEYDALLPATHLSAFAVSRDAARLAPFVRVIGADWESFRLANDKLRMTRHASSIGIACPEIYSDGEDDDIDAIAHRAR